MDVNKQCIFATRPWKVFGEGPASSEKLTWEQTVAALEISQPKTVPNNLANVFKLALR